MQLADFFRRFRFTINKLNASMTVWGSLFTSCSSHIFYQTQIISELFSFKYFILFSCQNSQLSAGGLFVCVTAISEPKFFIFVLPTAMRMGSLKLCPTIKRNYLWHVYFFCTVRNLQAISWQLLDFKADIKGWHRYTHWLSHWFYLFWHVIYDVVKSDGLLGARGFLCVLKGDN